MPPSKRSAPTRSKAGSAVLDSSEEDRKATRKDTGHAPNILRRMFEKAGFTHIPSDDIHFSFQGYKSDIDHIFAHENLLVLCEETTGSDIKSHFPGKQPFHRRMTEDPVDFLSQYCSHNADFAAYIGTCGYEPDEFEIRSLYYSGAADFSTNIQNEHSPFVLLSSTVAEYFIELADTIGRSARFEIFKFLDVRLVQLGHQKRSGQGVSINSFKGFVLPARHTSYGRDFILVSFYIDPKSLIRRAYVLRREGWMNSETSYQRFVRGEKLSQMRDYLANGGQVFLNNLILTLPPDTLLINKDGTHLSASTISTLEHVDIQLPDELGTVGIIDGQHRVLAYFEGEDEFEAGVASLRDRHNLLATGVILPKQFSQDERIKFEADLFLRINSTQTGVTDNLKQALETLIHPEKPISLVNLVLSQLAQSGPLAGLIQTTVTGGDKKIKTASFGRYALLPLMNPQGRDNLFTHWSGKGHTLNTGEDRLAFIAYTRRVINTMLGAMKGRLGDAWCPRPRGENVSGILNPTAIGGTFFYLKNLIAAGYDPEEVDFRKTFRSLTAAEFEPYSSSSWAALGRHLFESHPPKKAGSKQA